MSETLTPDQLIDALSKLGTQLQQLDTLDNELIESAKHYNGWFIPENVAKSITAIGQMLNPTDLTNWFALQLPRTEINIHQGKRVGLILAGNIPAVGFHDVLCVLVSGHKAFIKTSSQDQQLIPYILKKLIAIEPAFEGQITYISQLKNYDAVIATGSNNSARYFDYYFKNVPHIIRKNRNSVAVLTGNEKTADLTNLGHDIFDYFGLGCRNVSKLYVPKGYNFKPFFEAIESFSWVGGVSKYNNNYDYNKSIFLVNKEPHLDNGFLLLKADKSLQSLLATLYYEEYDNISQLDQQLATLSEQIQCVVSANPLQAPISQVKFGFSQKPKLWDYADGVDTMQFLLNL